MKKKKAFINNQINYVTNNNYNHRKTISSAFKDICSGILISALVCPLVLSINSYADITQDTKQAVSDSIKLSPDNLEYVDSESDKSTSIESASQDEILTYLGLNDSSVFDENEINIYSLDNNHISSEANNEATEGYVEYSSDETYYGEASSEEKQELIKAFVGRMYTVALGREAESAGLEDWSGRLTAQTIDGAGIAAGFIGSNEFTNKNLGNEEYLKVLYATFFDREPDESGYNDWLSKMSSGTSRGKVLAGFVNSLEFSNLCDKFGILRGYMMDDGSSANPGIGQFVTRLYTKALQREGDSKGINDWTAKIATGAVKAGDVAVTGFFDSPEFTSKQLTESEFVDILYSTFFNRKADSDGKYQWVFKLKVGLPKREVVKGFANSQEFSNLLTSYGLGTEANYQSETETDQVRILKAMLSFMDTYPEGTTYTNANYYGWKGGIYSGGYGCAGFAFMLSDAAFGNAKARKVYSLNNVRVGDILRINNDGHSVIVLSVNGDEIVVAEGNYNKSVHWGRVFNKNTIRFTYLMTRYD